MGSAELTPQIDAPHTVPEQGHTIASPFPRRSTIHQHTRPESIDSLSVISPFPSRRSLHADASLSSIDDEAADTSRNEALVGLDALPKRADRHARPTRSRRVRRTTTAYTRQNNAPSSRLRTRKPLALSVLAVATIGIAIPLSAFLSPQDVSNQPVAATYSGPAQTSWATIGNTTTHAGTLEAYAGAASRSRARQPLDVDPCVKAEGAADGNRAVRESANVMWPLKQGSYEVTSPFSMRVSPISGQLLMHEGVDMASTLGEPIHAIADGTVVEFSQDSRSGSYVRIEHRLPDGTVYYSAYAHQSSSDVLVKEGDTVTAGQVIGAVGNEGWSTGPHLHFEIRTADDTPVDPMQWMPEHQAHFLDQVCQ